MFKAGFLKPHVWARGKLERKNTSFFRRSRPTAHTNLGGVNYRQTLIPYILFFWFFFFFWLPIANMGSTLCNNAADKRWIVQKFGGTSVGKFPDKVCVCHLNALAASGNLAANS